MTVSGGSSSDGNNGNTSNATSVNSESHKATIFLVSFYWQMVVSSSSVVLNSIVLVTFIRVTSLLPAPTRVLMIHQTLLELLCSAFAIIWQQGATLDLYYPADLFGRVLCVLWSSVYWILVYCVQLNCVLITLDRYIAVCHPLTWKVTKRAALLAVGGTDLLTISVKFATQYGMYGLAEDHECVALRPQPGQLFAWGIYFTILYYLLPLAAVVVLYPPMILTIVASRKRFASSTQNDSSKRKSASRLVRTCLIAATALIVAEIPSLVFFNISYCLLNLPTVGFGAYQDAINTIFTSSYPFLSPIIYAFSTSKFRQSILCK